jgi:hypothetical protein
MSTSHISAECPRCRLALRLQTQYLGQRVSCRYCGHVFRAGVPWSPALKVVAQESDQEAAPPAGPGEGSGVSARGQARPAAADDRAWPRVGPDLRRVPPAGPGAHGPSAEWHQHLQERQQWARERKALTDEIEALKGDHDRTRDALTIRLDAARAEIGALRAEHERVLAELDRCKADRTAGTAARPLPAALPVLCSDLARWSIPSGRRPVAVPVGPPPLPPSIDDLATADAQVAMLRRLLRHTPAPGQGYHTLFDLERFRAIRSKLQEAALLADRLIKLFERSKGQKDLLWHLMLAQRSEELHRRR